MFDDEDISGIVINGLEDNNDEIVPITEYSKAGLKPVGQIYRKNDLMPITEMIKKSPAYQESVAFETEEIEDDEEEKQEEPKENYNQKRNDRINRIITYHRKRKVFMRRRGMLYFVIASFAVIVILSIMITS
ncbi:MAG: hypothetical protein K6D97_00420 [Clostridia bacterium]|nr:hypothetical protein [Clostridia bacterium]